MIKKQPIKTSFKVLTTFERCHIYLCLYLDILDRRVLISICGHFFIYPQYTLTPPPKPKKAQTKNSLEISLPVPFIKSWFAYRFIENYKVL